MKKFNQKFLTDWALIALSAIAFLSALLMPAVCGMAQPLSAEEEKLLSAYQAGELIRLHIVANSDSPIDQATKLYVRDAVIEVFGKQISQLSDQSCNAVFHYLQENVSSIEQEARKSAHSFSYFGEIKAQAGFMHLPEKRYGKITLPEGKYRALKITIGEGKGRNWWCVLYPQLCLALSQTEDSDKNKFAWASARIFSQWLLIEQ